MSNQKVSGLAGAGEARHDACIETAPRQAGRSTRRSVGPRGPQRPRRQWIAQRRKAPVARMPAATAQAAVTLAATARVIPPGHKTAPNASAISPPTGHGREPRLLGTCSTGGGPGPGPWSSMTRSGARMGDVGRLFCVAKGGGNPSNFCGRSSPAWRGTGAPSIRQPRPSPSLSTAGTPFSLPQRPLNGTVAPSAPPHRGSRCSRATHASLRASNSCASKRPLGAPGRTRPRALSLIRQAERSTAGLVGIDKGEDGACERRERG